MKLRGKVTVCFVALAAICSVLLLRNSNHPQSDLEATRRSLRQQGFKIELNEFNLATSPEMRRRAAVLGTTTWVAFNNRARPGPILGDVPRLLVPAAKNAAVVTWSLKKLRTARSKDFWPELRETLNINRARLDAAHQASLAGPIRFEPISGQRPTPMVPYLADLKGLIAAFGMQTMLALHDRDIDSAWTNLLASTCLFTAYEPEPVEVSHLVHFACATVAYGTMWNALQARQWTDSQLAELQQRWQGVDFWSALPETSSLPTI